MKWFKTIFFKYIQKAFLNTQKLFLSLSLSPNSNEKPKQLKISFILLNVFRERQLPAGVNVCIWKVFHSYSQNHTPLNIKCSFCADISSLIEFSGKYIMGNWKINNRNL